MHVTTTVWVVTMVVTVAALAIDVLVIVDVDATVRATQLLTQDEPILTIGVGPDALSNFVSGFAGVDVRQPARVLIQDGSVPDAVSGATISSGVIRNAVLRTGRLLAERAAMAPHPASATPSRAKDWAALVSAGKIGIRGDITLQWYGVETFGVNGSTPVGSIDSSLGFAGDRVLLTGGVEF